MLTLQVVQRAKMLATCSQQVVQRDNAGHMPTTAQPRVYAAQRRARRMSEQHHGGRREPHSRGRVGWHACSAQMRSQACMQRGVRADAFAEACEPILRLKFKLPVSATRNGFIIGVFLLMCPSCLHRQSSPPCAQFDHRHLLVRVLRHRCPTAARPVFFVSDRFLSAKLQFSSFAPKR